MADVTQTTRTAADDLFDKYLLPKAALAVILGASLVGTALTLELSGGAGVALAAVKWAYFVALGVLLGGLLWKHGFVRPGDLEDAGDYCAELYRRFDRIAAAALAVLAVTGIALLATVYSDLSPAFRVGLAGVLAIAVVAATLDVLDGAAADARFRTPAGLFALVAVTAATVATATADVLLAGGGTVAASARAIHLLAFATWVGGAVWNIFVAVPTGQLRPTPSVVSAAGEQLERFRWTVRVIIPTLLLTGVYQSIDVLGTSPGTYLGTAVGLAVLAKLAFVVVLFGIFLTCPMWRACSPIDGVCDLADAPAGDD